jgi:Arm domain-containing DNA-binding protein
MAGIDSTTPDGGRKKSPNKFDFTDRGLRALKPAEKAVTYWDARTANFGIRVTENGAKSFVVVCRQKGHGRKPVKITLGKYVPRPDSPTVTLANKEPREVQLGDDLTLSEARELADVVRRDLRRGVNPRKEQKRQEEAKRSRSCAGPSTCSRKSQRSTSRRSCRSCAAGTSPSWRSART